MAKKDQKQASLAAPTLPALWHDITCSLNFSYAGDDLTNSPFQTLACRASNENADLAELRGPMAFRLKLLGTLEELGQYLPPRTRVEIVFTTTPNPATAQPIQDNEDRQ